MREYPLFYDHGWWIDFAELELKVGERTRALVVVHPNNPTGHGVSRAERQELRRFAARHRLTLIVDEVFLDYPISAEQPLETFALERSETLLFVLSGLSKVAALPQMKVGWIVVCGPAENSTEALSRLEIIADTFLSVNTPAQLALPGWLLSAPRVQEKIIERVLENLTILRQSGLKLIQPEAGWSAIVRLDRTFSQPDAATALLEHRILTHPGAFYGLTDPGQVVLSLLTPLPTMQDASQRMAAMNQAGRSNR